MKECFYEKPREYRIRLSILRLLNQSVNVVNGDLTFSGPVCSVTVNHNQGLSDMNRNVLKRSLNITALCTLLTTDT